MASQLLTIEPFFDKNTFTLTYVVFDPSSKDAIVIDPVLDYHIEDTRIETHSYQQVHQFITAQGLNLHYVLETHAHADHLSASQLFKQDFPEVKIAISEHIMAVQNSFKSVFDLKDEQTDGSQFDYLIKDDETLTAGSLKIKALHTPGHTPACLSYLIDDVVFTGDALFMPDYGTGRCDFPKGDAQALYHSVHDVLYRLDDDTRVFVGHDYLPGGRALKYETTIAESKQFNRQLSAQTSQLDYVNFRQQRDATLNPPKLLYPSIQVNIAAGQLPDTNESGYFSNNYQSIN